MQQECADTRVRGCCLGCHVVLLRPPLFLGSVDAWFRGRTCTGTWWGAFVCYNTDRFSIDSIVPCRGAREARMATAKQKTWLIAVTSVGERVRAPLRHKVGGAGGKAAPPQVYWLYGAFFFLRFLVFWGFNVICGASSSGRCGLPLHAVMAVFVSPAQLGAFFFVAVLIPRW